MNNMGVNIIVNNNDNKNSKVILKLFVMPIIQFCYVFLQNKSITPYFSYTHTSNSLNYKFTSKNLKQKFFFYLYHENVYSVSCIEQFVLFENF